jgi:hypothetical protein
MKKHRKLHPLSQHCSITDTTSSLHNDFCPIDAGGAFIHGIDGNPIHEICQKIGISTSRPLEGEDCLLMEYNSGWPVSAEIDYKVQKRFNYVLDQAFRMSRQITTLVQGEGTKEEQNHSISTSTTTRAITGEKNVTYPSESNEHDEKKVPEPDNISSQQNGQHDELAAKLKSEDANLPVPEWANANTSFGTIFEYVAADGQSIDISATSSNNKFLRNGNYPDNSIEASLFGWHVMNLEMSCGTTFDKLGMTWNDDEAYGYGGDHVLLKEGFGSLIEGLKDGVDIRYCTEVTGIRIVEGNDEEELLLEPKDEVIDGTKQNTKVKRMVPPSEPSSTRRSSRANKGKVNRMNIGHLNRNQKELGTYDLSNELLSAYSKKTKEAPNIVTKYPVQVRINDNSSTLHADAVVCTLPLGVIGIPKGEPGHVEFIPSLPDRKQLAAERLGFGNYNKCILSFPQVFWSSAADFVGVVGSPVLGSDILFCNVSVVHELPVIVVIFGGSYADKVETFTDEQVVRECLDVLQRVCSNNNIPAPIDYCVTRWGQDKFARGSFSYCPVGIDGERELSIMSEPCYAKNRKDFPSHPLILFAGEATTPYHPSTIHGAYLSGIREAYRLDLALFPEQNNFLEFDDSYLYKRTFPLRRRFLQKDTNVPITMKKELITISPLRRQSKVGTRKSDRHAKLQQSPKRKIDTVVKEGIRKSRRVKDVMPPVSMKKSANYHNSRITLRDEFDSKSFLISEDIALLRGVDTFGRDGMKLIKEYMFPVPRTSVAGIEREGRKRSSAALEERYKELLTEGADLEAKNTRPIAKEWTTSKASNVWWTQWENKHNTIKPHNRRNNTIEKVSSTTRSSSRKRTPRKPTLYEDL